MTNQIPPAVEREIEKRAEEYFSGLKIMRGFMTNQRSYLAGARAQYLEDRKVIEGLVRVLKKYAEANELKGYLHPADLAREALKKYEAWKGKEE